MSGYHALQRAKAVTLVHRGACAEGSNPFNILPVIFTSAMFFLILFTGYRHFSKGGFGEFLYCAA